MVTRFGDSILAGFFSGIVAWTLFFSTLVHEGVSRYARVYPALVAASGVILLAFGVWFLYSAISSSV